MDVSEGYDEFLHAAQLDRSLSAYWSQCTGFNNHLDGGAE
jgi:hypothetical protein